MRGKATRQSPPKQEAKETKTATKSGTARQPAGQSRPAPSTARKPATSKPAASKPAASKPAASKAQKPAASKAQKPAASKAQKPATSKAQTAASKAQKPAASKARTAASKAQKPAQSKAQKPAQSKGREARADESTRARDLPRLLDILAQTWSEAHVELDHESAYELLVATILSAQSTDKRINQVTPALFASYPNARALAAADQAELEEQIRSTGFFRMKAKHLLGMARALVEHHDGEIPRTMDELLALPGVARKTANVVLGSFFGIPSGIVVDTHVTRVARRLGLTEETDPEKIERDLMTVIPRERWIDFAHQLIWHGRRICFARKPACDVCPLAPLCPSAGIGARAVPAEGEHGEPLGGPPEDQGDGPRASQTAELEAP